MLAVCRKPSHNHSDTIFGVTIVDKPLLSTLLSFQVNPYRQQLRTQQPNDRRVRPACR
jgi:hypothetical protein